MAVRCIKCGKPADEVVIGVSVETGVIRCGECEEEYGVDEVVDQITEWQVLVDWVRQHPNRLENALEREAAGKAKAAG